MCPDSNLDEFRVAISTQPPDLHELSTVFQEVLSIHPTDAMVWARHLPGILTQSFSASQAQTLTAALQALGLHVIVFRQDETPILQTAQEVHHARCEENGLQILDLHGESEKIIPWPAVQMICVGEAPLETTYRYPAGTWAGVSAGRHYQRPELQVPLTPNLEVWIACASPFPALRISDKKMNYEYLGPRRQDSSSANFLMFVQDISENANAALLTESTVAYLKHDHPQRYRFQSAEAMEQFATLQTLVARESAFKVERDQ
jgi:hypothetical protein